MEKLKKVKLLKTVHWSRGADGIPKGIIGMYDGGTVLELPEDFAKSLVLAGEGEIIDEEKEAEAAQKPFMRRAAKE